MSRSTLLLAAALLSLGVGCGKDAEPNGSERMTVRGTVSQLSVGQGARAVAVGADGRTVWANLDAHGDFSLRLPLGTSYRIVIANPRATAGHLVLGTGAASTRWIAARTATTIDLGRLSPATTTTATTGGIRTQSSGAGELESADSDSDDDAKEHEDDAESQDGSENEVCSGGSSDVELRASSEPGEDAKDSAEHDDKDDDCNESENENETDDD